MLKTTRRHQNLSYKSDEYDVYHVKDHDYYCDLHILACTPDEQVQILIPVDKIFMIDNLTYFENMFKLGSNWEEGHSDDGDKIKAETDNKNTNSVSTCSTAIKPEKFPAQLTTIIVPSPLLLGEYIKSVYNESLEINPQNCADFHYIADFLQDEGLLYQIENYVKKNITFENSIDLMGQSNKFEKVIKKYYTENSMGDEEVVKFAEDLCEMEIGKFVKMMELLDGTVSWVG